MTKTFLTFPGTDGYDVHVRADAILAVEPYYATASRKRAEAKIILSAAVSVLVQVTPEEVLETLELLALEQAEAEQERLLSSGAELMPGNDEKPAEAPATGKGGKSGGAS